MPGEEGQEAPGRRLARLKHWPIEGQTGSRCDDGDVLDMAYIYVQVGRRVSVRLLLVLEKGAVGRGTGAWARPWVRRGLSERGGGTQDLQHLLRHQHPHVRQHPPPA